MLQIANLLSGRRLFDAVSRVLRGSRPDLEVSEVPWSEWEDCVSRLEDRDTVLSAEQIGSPAFLSRHEVTQRRARPARATRQPY